MYLSPLTVYKPARPIHARETSDGPTHQCVCVAARHITSATSRHRPSINQCVPPSTIGVRSVPHHKTPTPLRASSVPESSARHRPGCMQQLWLPPSEYCACAAPCPQADATLSELLSATPQAAMPEAMPEAHRRSAWRLSIISTAATDRRPLVGRVTVRRGSPRMRTPAFATAPTACPA